MVTVPHVHRGEDEDFPSLPATETELVFPCKDLTWAAENSMLMYKAGSLQDNCLLAFP